MSSKCYSKEERNTMNTKKLTTHATTIVAFISN